MPKLKNRNDLATQLKEDAERALMTALNQDEKILCQNVVVFGPGWLRQNKGWKKEAISTFLARKEVVAEIDALKRAYEDRAGVQERTQFFAQLRINGMVPFALNVLAKAMAGEKKDKATGEVSTPPTRMQFDAALQVLDRANVQGKTFAGNDSTPSIDARSVSIAVTGTSESLGVDREARARIAKMLKSVQRKIAADTEAEQAVSEKVVVADEDNEGE